MKTPSLILALFAAAGLGTAVAQPMLTRDDRHFLRTAMEGGRAEVALAREVLRHTQNPRAVRFARRMLADHVPNNEQLTALAQRLGVQPESGIDDEARDEMQKLQGMRGDALAREYLSFETQDHEKDISDFRQELNSTSNPQIRTYVRTTLPVLRQHLDLARELENRY